MSCMAFLFQGQKCLMVTLVGVLWKCLNTETSQFGNVSKTAFEEFPFYFGKPLKTGKRWGISEYFWGVSQYLKYFLRRFRFFLRRFCKIFEAFPNFWKLCLVEVFPQTIWGVSVFLKTLFSWGVSAFFLRRFRKFLRRFRIF